MKFKEGWLFLLLAPALVAGCFFAPYIGFDDSAHVDHELLKPGVTFFDTFKPTENSTYFPITILSYRFDLWLAKIFGATNPAPIMRADSLLLHTLAAFFLWRALLALGLNRWLSFFAAASWLAHPAACESVAWVSERKNVLAGFFGFASLWVWFCSPLPSGGEGPGVRGRRYILTFILFTLALLSKPTAAGFLPVYFVYDILRVFRSPNPFPPLLPPNLKTRLRIPSLITFILMIVLIILLAQVNYDKTTRAYVQIAGGNHFTAALTDVPILVQYIYNSLLPISLSIFYYSPIITSPADTHFILNLLILAAIVFVTFKFSPNRTRTLFYWGWFVGALGPALNIIPLPYLMQDRYAYFSLPAILLLAGETFASVYNKLVPNYSSSLPKIAAIGIPVLLAISSIFRSGVYAHDIHLFTDAIQKQPQSAYAQQFYAITLAEAADRTELLDGSPEAIVPIRQEALKHLGLSAQSPDFDRLLEPGRVKILIGVLNERLGNSAAAVPILLGELKKPLKPYNRVIGFMALARISLKANDAETARKYVDDAASASTSRSDEIQFLKALCLEKLDRKTEAIDILRGIPEKSMTYKRAQAELKRMNP